MAIRGTLKESNGHGIRNSLGMAFVARSRFSGGPGKVSTNWSVF